MKTELLNAAKLKTLAETRILVRILVHKNQLKGSDMVISPQFETTIQMLVGSQGCFLNDVKGFYLVESGLCEPANDFQHLPQLKFIRREDTMEEIELLVLERWRRISAFWLQDQEAIAVFQAGTEPPRLVPVTKVRLMMLLARMQEVLKREILEYKQKGKAMEERWLEIIFVRLSAFLERISQEREKVEGAY